VASGGADYRNCENSKYVKFVQIKQNRQSLRLDLWDSLALALRMKAK
jgi:hypothetical protein